MADLNQDITQINPCFAGELGRGNICCYLSQLHLPINHLVRAVYLLFFARLICRVTRKEEMI